MYKMIFFMIFILFNFDFWNFMYLMIFSLIMFSIMFFPNFYFYFINNFFFIDNLNFWLIILTLWILFLMMLSMYKIKIGGDFFLPMIYLFFLCIFLIFAFLVNNLIYFYVFFEMSLIPTLYLIMGWGYQPERIMAGFYLLFYTLIASLPLLMGLLFMLNNFKVFQFFNFNFYIYDNLLYFSLCMAFLVKMPMFMVHLWLPKAHVEAPISGSMILAAILLKLGGYGLLRIFSFLIFFFNINLMFIIISLWGGVMISFNCFRQLDLKLLIAYSSVAHMGLVLGGLFSLTIWGVNGSFFMMIAHGLCSSGLFCLANISYERTQSRSMNINKGMLSFMPSMGLWWFLLVANNMSSPISLNLISEISLVNSIISISYIFVFLIFMLCFFSASYCFYLFSFSQHGMFYSGIFCFSNSSVREMMLMFFHWLPLNIIFLKLLLMY